MNTRHSGGKISIRWTKILGTAWILLASAAACAQTGLEQALEECAQISLDRARLSCFDVSDVSAYGTDLDLV